jgi:hypothetical protein
MKLTQITVHAGRTFNHPYESFSNLRNGITLVVSIDGEDEQESVRRAQIQVNMWADQDKKRMLGLLKDQYEEEEEMRRREFKRESDPEIPF